jgi:F0F1-type ATP synthase assembly protein I
MHRVTLLGATVGVAFLIVGAVLLGYWLDTLLGTAPWVMLTLIILSVVGSMALKIWIAMSLASEMTHKTEAWSDNDWEEEE